jgi:hypothetical protein
MSKPVILSPAFAFYANGFSANGWTKTAVIGYPPGAVFTRSRPRGKSDTG